MNTRDGLCNGDWIIIIVSEPRDRIMQYHLPRFLVGTVYLIMGDRLAFTRMDSKAGRRIEIASRPSFPIFPPRENKIFSHEFRLFFFLYTHIYIYFEYTSDRSAGNDMHRFLLDSKTGARAKRILFSLR